MEATRFGNWPAARMAAALAATIEEHGAPNSFSPAEIVHQHPVKVKIGMWRDIGRWARSTDFGRSASPICHILGENGYVVRYSERRFVVESMPADR